MPWGRVDDDFYDHPKVLALGRQRLACIGLYFLAISWSNRYLTDGRLDLRRLQTLGGDQHSASRLADRLVEAGLFDRDGEDYLIHDFLTRNKSRQQVQIEREQKVEAGRRGGLARAGRLAGDPADGKRDAKQTASTVLSTVPSTVLSTIQAPGASPRPVPSESDLSTPTPLGAVAAQPRGESFEWTGPRLTRAALDGWAAFEAKEWEPFKTAWLARGLLLPPFGDATDDADSSQRARLWKIAEDQPKALGRWVKEAPGKTAHDVLAYVFEQRAKLAAEVGVEAAATEAKAEAEAEAGERERRAPRSVADILHDDWISGGRP
jgi:hypothetical protein